MSELKAEAINPAESLSVNAVRCLTTLDTSVNSECYHNLATRGGP